jgi:hypothetical protein
LRGRLKEALRAGTCATCYRFPESLAMFPTRFSPILDQATSSLVICLGDIVVLAFVNAALIRGCLESSGIDE